VRRLERLDLYLLAILLPLWLIGFALHVHSGFTTRLAAPAVYAAPPRGDDPYPRVGGVRPETWAETALRPGDRLISAGARDLRGVGYVGFEATLLDEARRANPVPVVYERGGARRTTTLSPIPYPVPWFRIPFLVGMVAAALVVMLRGRDAVQARLYFAGSVGLALVLMPFRGGPYLATATYMWVLIVGGALATPLYLASLFRFPESPWPPTRWELLWCAGVFLLYAAARASYVLGFPLPSELAPRAVLAVDALFIASILLILTRSYRKGSALRRRRIRWVLLGAWIAGVPLLANVLIPVLDPDTPKFQELQVLSALAMAVVPIALLISIVRYNVFDVDRLLTSAASYSLGLVALLGVLLAAAPFAGRVAADALGVGHGLAQLAVSLALAAVLVPLGRWLQPRVERVFFPERRELARGIERLREDLESCEALEVVLLTLAGGLEALLRPERCVVYLRSAHGFSRCFASGVVAPGEISAAAPAAVLGGQGGPLRVSEASRRGALQPGHREELVALGLELLLPLRRGNELLAFVGLGPKRSGDVYTATELSLLAAASDCATAQVERTRQGELEEQVQATSAESLARSKFLAEASHDLRQPLQAIELFAAALTDRARDPELRALAERIQRASGSLEDLLNGVLDVSRVEAGALAPQPRDFALAPLLASVVDDLAPVADAKGLSLNLLPTNAVVHSDPLQLGRILRNLVSNAVRYTHEGGVLVACRPDGGDWRIDVADTGIGVALDKQSEVFRPFERASPDEKDGGLGLGLAIVERLARALGHRVSLSSQPGRGSRFSVHVPCGTALAAGESARAAARRDDPLGGLVVLVLEDDPDVADGLRAVLGQWGCRALLARSAEEARTRVAETWPDVAIADHELRSGVSGREALESIAREHERALRRVFLTGDAESASREASASDVVLRKPVAPARLRAALRLVLASGAAR
jgi:signal transduction histidine kinase